MDIEEHVEAPEASSNDDLRSALESAVRESASREDHSAEPSEAPAANRTAVERARDASGKFAPKPADAPGQVAKPTETALQQPEGTAPAATRKAPASWSPEHQQSFATLPPAIQEQILKREADVAKGFEERAGKAKAYDELEGIIGPHRESLSRRGMSPAQAINVLLDVQRQFDRDPRDAWLRLGAQFGFVKAPAGSPQQAAQQQPQAPQRPAGPPLEHVVQRQIESTMQRTAIQNEIQAFAADPANKHYEVLKPAMQLMLQSGRASSLREAYDSAAWLEPAIRDQLIAERTAPAAASARSAADQAAVARARSAASGVRGAPNGATTPAPTSKGSLRDDIRAAVQAHRA